MICHHIKECGTEQAAREPGSGLLDPPAGCRPFDSTRQREEGETQRSLGSSSLLDHINTWSVSDLYKTTNMQEECLIKLCWLQHQHPRDNNEGSATWLASSETVLGRPTLLKMWTLEEKKGIKKTQTDKYKAWSSFLLYYHYEDATRYFIWSTIHFKKGPQGKNQILYSNFCPKMGYDSEGMKLKNLIALWKSLHVESYNFLFHRFWKKSSMYVGYNTHFKLSNYLHELVSQASPKETSFLSNGNICDYN